MKPFFQSLLLFDFAGSWTEGDRICRGIAGIRHRTSTDFLESIAQAGPVSANGSSEPESEVQPAASNSMKGPVVTSIQKILNCC
jgi:hypothetical protein